MVEWLGFNTFTAGSRVQSLVRELRSHKSSHKPSSEKKKERETESYFNLVLTFKQGPNRSERGSFVHSWGVGRECSRKREQQVERPRGRCVLIVSEVFTSLSRGGSPPHSRGT